MRPHPERGRRRGWRSAVVLEGEKGCPKPRRWELSCPSERGRRSAWAPGRTLELPRWRPRAPRWAGGGWTVPGRHCTVQHLACPPGNTLHASELPRWAQLALPNHEVRHHTSHAQFGCSKVPPFFLERTRPRGCPLGPPFLTHPLRLYSSLYVHWSFASVCCILHWCMASVFAFDCFLLMLSFDALPPGSQQVLSKQRPLGRPQMWLSGLYCTPGMGEAPTKAENYTVDVL